MLLLETSAALNTLVKDMARFKEGLILDDKAYPQLPAQIGFAKLQKLAAKARDDPENDFLEVASEYAEHASAARDLVKLARLGRQGENGSEDVVKLYADRAVGEVELAASSLSVLASLVK